MASRKSDSWNRLTTSNHDLSSGYGKAQFVNECNANKINVPMTLKSLDIVCASYEEEFFYKGSNRAVPEGTPIGFDVDMGKEVELVLFSDIEWRPNY